LIRVAFWFDRPIEYTGGLNYIKNLLYAVSLVNNGRIDPYIFMSAGIEEDLARELAPLATVVRTPVLERNSPWWYLDRVLFKVFGSQPLVKRELGKRAIQVVSHAVQSSGIGAPFRVISWLPDFQFLHLPHFFPELKVGAEIRRTRKSIEKSDATILSSHAAYKDFCSIAPAECVARAHVLQFVSQPDSGLGVVDDAAGKAAIERKYGFTGRYFYLPNQFWAHKNHWVVFKAVAELKARGIDVLVICTGNLNDYRLKGTGHVDSLRKFIVDNSLERNVLILGLLPYQDVLFLMRNCVAVINPSRFEGWSSTVEEAKSIGKSVLLSDIAVHREQNPMDGRYFDPDNDNDLACKMLEVWNEQSSCDADRRKAAAAAALRERTLAYGEAYVRLVEAICS
jgi:glycosyltransferase involved in cell wall biosynthesis